MPNLKTVFKYFILILIMFIVTYGAIFVTGCSRPSKDEQAKQLIGESVVIILASEPDVSSNVLTIQDYIREGKSYVPFFSSKNVFKESTNGVDIGKPVYEIDRRLFVEMLRPQEICILNVGLKSEITFTGEDLKRIFPEPFNPEK